MRDFAIFALFSIFYILLVLLFQGISGAQVVPPSGIIPPSDTHQPEFPTPQQQPTTPSPKSSNNPLVDIFQVEDHETKNLLDTVYGTYTGNNQCERKSACILGNYMKDMPGRDLMFIFLGGYIPPQYSLFYDIFRSSAMYGQNCDVYVCIPQAPSSPVAQKSQPR